MKEKIKGFILPTVLTLAFLLIYFYLALPALNILAGGFWLMIFLAAIIFVVTYLYKNNREFLKKLGNR